MSRRCSKDNDIPIKIGGWDGKFVYEKPKLKEGYELVKPTRGKLEREQWQEGRKEVINKIRNENSSTTTSSSTTTKSTEETSSTRKTATSSNEHYVGVESREEDNNYSQQHHNTSDDQHLNAYDDDEYAENQHCANQSNNETQNEYNYNAYQQHQQHQQQQHHQQQQQQQQHQHQTHQLEPPHHLRHQFRSRSPNGIHHKQHNHHQSNDSAYNRVPSYERQAHSPKKYAHNDDVGYAPAPSRVGVHLKNPTQHQHQYQQQQHQQQPYHLTTMGPYRSNHRPYGRGWPASNEKRNWADNLSRNRQAPYENTHSSSISRNRTINPYMRSHHSPRHPTAATTTSTTTTTPTTSTLAPDMPEKMFFDVQSSFNNIESDNFDYDFDSSETYDTKKRSPPSAGGDIAGVPFDRDDRLNQPNNENQNIQHDDPVRSSTSSSSSYSNNNNGVTTSAFKSQQSSNGDNYQLNVNNDGSTNNRRSTATTIETSKSLGNDVKTTNLMTRNIQTRVSA